MLTLQGVANEDADTSRVGHVREEEGRSESIDIEVTRLPMRIVPLAFSPSNARIHSDLHCLTPHTLAKWLHVKIPNLILIDCRYPYEYEGGHIEGALNLHTEELVHDTLLKDTPSSSSRAPVVVFHCEFSSCRGPTRYRYLRNQDRKANVHRYPHLFYPHVYLLEGGYSRFYGLFPSLCTGGYVQMTDKKYKEQKRAMKSKSKCNLMGALNESY